MRTKNITNGLLIVLLSISSLLKLGKFPGSGIVLVAFFIIFSGALFVELSRHAETPENNGKVTVYISSIIIIIFIAFLWFKILQLQGAPILGLIAVPAMCLFFPAMSIYFFGIGSKASKNGLIQFLQYKQAYLNKAALLIIAFAVILDYEFLLFRTSSFLAVLFLIFGITLIGLIIFGGTWTYYTRSDPKFKKYLLLISSSMALVMFLIPILGRNYVDQLIGNVAAYGAFLIYIIIIIVHYASHSLSTNKKPLIIISSLLLLYTIFKFGINMQLIQLPNFLRSNVGLNIALLLTFTALMIGFRKEHHFKWLMILTIVSHLFPSPL